MEEERIALNLTSLREWAHRYRYPIFAIYYTLYMVSFVFVEKIKPDHIYIIHSPIDQYIPFVEFFVIPYLAWFFYIGGVVIWLFFFDRETMCRLLWCGMIGMTVFVLISYFLPNGLELRPEAFVRDNIFTRLTKVVYSHDTATNVFPSIHVNNSICASAALLSSEKLRGRKGWRVFAVVMAGLIILSTMFLKQHSVIDVTGGMVTGFLSVEIFFGNELKGLAGRVRFKLIQRTRSCL